MISRMMVYSSHRKVIKPERGLLSLRETTTGVMEILPGRQNGKSLEGLLFTINVTGLQW